VKDCYGLDLERFLAELATACQVEEASAIERRHAEAALMTWEDVVALDRAGMDVGSHTCSHRVLQTLPPEEIGHELRQSRQDLEARLNKPVLAIAYPVGHSIAQVPFIREAVRSAGYELGFTTTPGWNRRAPAGDQLDLKRISIDHGTSAARTRASLAFPRFAR
jgi:peptidoglycan/xylan/chitin deacetylase (PgdA/CDA1 family)